MKYARRDARIYTDLEPIDMNDPESAATAIEYGLPESFSGKAKACWQYFSGAAYLFEYKGQLVMTDESLSRQSQSMVVMRNTVCPLLFRSPTQRQSP
jgi:hypothetical protein